MIVPKGRLKIDRQFIGGIGTTGKLVSLARDAWNCGLLPQ